MKNKNKIKNELEKFIENKRQKQRQKQSNVKQPSCYEMTIRRKIENCLENFDFRKVNKVMKLLRWSWFNVPNNTIQIKTFAKDLLFDGVPNIIQMETLAKDLLFDASKNIGTDFSCGGFVASWNYEDKELYCSLSFVVDESCSDYDFSPLNL